MRRRTRAAHLALVVLIAAGLAGPALAVADDEPSSPGTTSRYRLPVEGPGRVLDDFDPPRTPWAAGHRGVDLAAAPGSDVRAPGAGTVTFVGSVAGRPVLTVAHADGLRSSLEPVVADVARGDRVAAGDVVGVVAPTGGHCGGSCVHWGVREGPFDPPHYVDPLVLVGRAAPIVLLPDATIDWP